MDKKQIKGQISILFMVFFGIFLFVILLGIFITMIDPYVLRNDTTYSYLNTSGLTGYKEASYNYQKTMLNQSGNIKNSLDTNSSETSALGSIQVTAFGSLKAIVSLPEIVKEIGNDEALKNSKTIPPVLIVFIVTMLIILIILVIFAMVLRAQF